MKQLNICDGNSSDAGGRFMPPVLGRRSESLRQKILDGKWSYASILTGPCLKELQANTAAGVPSRIILADTEAIVMQDKIQRALKSGVRLGSRAYAIIFKEAFAINVSFDFRSVEASVAKEYNLVNYSGRARFEKNPGGRYTHFFFPVHFCSYNPASLGNMGSLYIPPHTSWRNPVH
jgi:hypothetical protein